MKSKVRIPKKIEKLFTSKNICLCIAILVPAFFAALLCNQTMPYAEGWYTYYAQCINEGMIPYKDFEYLFSPLYLYFIAVFTRIFGYKIIAVRILGVVMFGTLGGMLYLTFRKLFKNWIACIGAVTAAFYLQSEPVQIFYDYVRLMDIFAITTTYFLVSYVIELKEQEKTKKVLILAGVFNALFILVKQNMGLLFAVFTLVFIIFSELYYGERWKNIFKRLGNYLMGLLPPIFICGIGLLCNGSLSYFLGATGGGAVEAKGGMIAILFNWIVNGFPIFREQFKTAVFIITIIVLFIMLSHFFPRKRNIMEEKWHYAILLVYAGIVVLLIGVFSYSADIGYQFMENRNNISPYMIFIIVFLLFFSLGVFYLFQIICRKQNMKLEKLEELFPVFTVAGAYFAISYGCGTSGGLAEGQASLGVGLVIGILFTTIQFKGGLIAKAVIAVTCALLALVCADKKMVTTYNWWGMTEENFWDSRIEMGNIPLLEGIGVSGLTYDAYEGIYEAVTENTTEGDTMFCFPQIPIFYSLCDRFDPGTYTKVQWFDVATDEAVLADIEVLKENPPKAILIYNTSEYAYSSHENSFRNGKMSATRKMREFLLNYVYEQGYTAYGNYVVQGNSLSLWINDSENLEERTVFTGGIGTKKDPYQVSTAEQLVLLSEMVNDGRTFEGQYIEQTCDIDMSEISNFKPIGLVGEDCYFLGTYNGAGHAIKNLSIKKGSKQYNAGLFGMLGGTVCNLGIVDAELSSGYNGVIASQASRVEARIVNCYVIGTNVSGHRSGGIADDFMGTIANCVFEGTLNGNYGGLVSWANGTQVITNSFIVEGSTNVEVHRNIGENLDIKEMSAEYAGSKYVIEELNDYVYAFAEENKKDIKLLKWHISQDGIATIKSK